MELALVGKVTDNWTLSGAIDITPVKSALQDPGRPIQIHPVRARLRDLWRRKARKGTPGLPSVATVLSRREWSH